MNERNDQSNGPTPPERASSGQELVTAELMSAYLDDPADLTIEQRAVIEAALASNADTRQLRSELEYIVRELGNLPEPALTRSFQLTPEMVAAERPVVLQDSRAWYERHADKVRWAAAAAAVLFIAVLTADLASNRFDRQPTESHVSTTLRAADASESQANVEPTAEAQLEAGDNAEQATSAAAGGEAAQAPQAATTAGTEAEDTLLPGAGLEATSAAEATLPQMSAFSLEVATPPEESAATIAKPEANSDLYWRVAEFGLVIVFVILIAIIVFLPQRARSRHVQRWP